MLGHRLRHWPSIEPALTQYLMVVKKAGDLSSREIYTDEKSTRFSMAWPVTPSEQGSRYFTPYGDVFVIFHAISQHLSDE